MFSPLVEALLYATSIWAIFLILRVVRFPDISADNVFSLGSIGGAFVLLRTNSIGAALVAAFALGAAAGATTSVLHSLLRVPKLLAGVIMFSVLYSINLKFFGKPNVSLGLVSFPLNSIFIAVIVDLLIVVLISFGLRTKLGHSLIGLGENPSILAEFGAPRPILLAIGLASAGGLFATSGFLASLRFGFSDVSLGAGVLVNSVAALLVGEVCANAARGRWMPVFLFLGGLLYFAVTYVVVRYLTFGLLDYSDYKIVSAGLIVILFALNKRRPIDLMSFS